MSKRRDRLTASGLSDGLDTGDQVTDLSWTQFGHGSRDGSAHTDLDRLLWRPGLHEHQLRTIGEATVHHPDRADDAAVLVVLAVEDQRLQRRIRVALRRGDALAHGIEQQV